MTGSGGSSIWPPHSRKGNNAEQSKSSKRVMIVVGARLPEWIAIGKHPRTRLNAEFIFLCKRVDEVINLDKRIIINNARSISSLVIDRDPN